MVSTRKKQLRKEMTDDAKVSSVNSLISNPNNSLNKEHLKSLLDKYGPYAYDIIKQAQSEPANLMKRAGQGFLNTRKSIEYFATQDISTTTLAKALNKKESDALSMDASIAKYKIDQNIPQSPKMEEVKKEAETQKQKVEARIDNREPVVHIVNDNENKQEAANQATKGNIPSTALSTAEVTMTLDDYVKYYKPEDKPLTGKALQDAAYNDFGKGEGVSLKIYTEWDNKGNPTIGKGNLIFPAVLLDPKATAAQKKRAGNLDAYKERFMNMDLTKTVGTKQIPLSKIEKGKIFDDLVTATKNNTLRTQNVNGVRVVVSPKSAAQVNMSQTSMRKTFDKDFNYNLNRVYEGLGKGNKKEGEEIFNKYNKDLQLSLLHAYYAGNPGVNIGKAIKSGQIDPKDPVEVLTKLAEERIVGDDKALTSLKEMNPEYFTDAKIAELKKKYKNKKNLSRIAPRYDARQMGAASDTLRTCQELKQAEMQLQMQKQNQQTQPNIIQIAQTKANQGNC